MNQLNFSSSRIKSILRKERKLEDKWSRSKVQAPKTSGLVKANQHQSKSNCRTVKTREYRMWVIVWDNYKEANMRIRVSQWYQRVSLLLLRNMSRKWIRARQSSLGWAREVWYKIRAKRALLTSNLNYQWVLQTLKTQLKFINMESLQQQIRLRLHSVLK